MSGEIVQVKIANFLVNLPREELLKQTKSEEAKNFWLALRRHNHLIAKCLYSRAFKTDNPIAHLQDRDKLSNLYHNFIWRIVDVYEAVWEMMQIAFSYKFQLEFKRLNLSCPFNSAYDLFLQILGTERDNEFRAIFHYYKVSVPDTLKVWELIRKAAWSDLLQKEKKKIDYLTRQEPRNAPLELTYIICCELAKTDSLVADKLQDFRKRIGRLADSHISLIGNARKGRIQLKLRSYEFRNQQQFFANQHGGTYKKA
jgi:hypothetical protein